MTILGLYPRRWRARYGEEMAALLDARPATWRDRRDLVRGALDAWLHPPTPSRIPAVAAIAGGGLWTVVAAGVLFGPVQPDWPGYLMEIVPVVAIAVIFLAIAVVGCALRSGDRGAGVARITTTIAIVGYIAWIAMLAGTLLGWADGPGLAAAQGVAIVGTTLIGAGAVMAGDTTIGGLVTASGLAMLVPWSAGWLVFGTAWTAIGILLWIERVTRTEPAGSAS
jgi:hypothetical protein